MKQSKSVLVFGEVLIDRFDTGQEKRGGAPFNVAWHLKGLNEQAVFISRIGNDETGNQLISDMQQWDMDTIGIQKDENLPTGFVSIRNQATNPEFEIHTNVAYDNIDPNDINDLILSKGNNLIYHGSLALRSPLSKSAFELLLSHNKSVPVFFDVNIRPPWWDLDMVRHYLIQTTYLKCNENELSLLVPDQDNVHQAAQQLKNEFDLHSIIVTLGDKGAFAYTKDGEYVHSETRATDPILNSVGAGDAFSAVMIKGILNNWPIKVSLERANTFASAICYIDGAVPDSINFYNKILHDWK